jgi:hypothetical protein
VSWRLRCSFHGHAAATCGLTPEEPLVLLYRCVPVYSHEDTACSPLTGAIAPAGGTNPPLRPNGG